jgi:hypothetical protein
MVELPPGSGLGVAAGGGIALVVVQRCHVAQETSWMLT